MITYIEYKGQKLPFIYNYYAESRLLIDEQENYLNKGKELNRFHQIELTFFYGLEMGHEEKNIPFVLTRKDEEGKDITKPFTKRDATFLVASIGFEKALEILQMFDSPEDEEGTVAEDSKEVKKK